eukprot:scaffold97848_cov69-Attheya_sp.AAC.3
MDVYLKENANHDRKQTVVELDDKEFMDVPELMTPASTSNCIEPDSMGLFLMQEGGRIQDN